MAKPFNAANAMKNLGGLTSTAEGLAAKEAFPIKYIPQEAIVGSEKNFFELSDIEALAESITLEGLYHNLVVRPLDTDPDRYELISGERRLTAIRHMISIGNARYARVPCNVVLCDEEEAEIRLIRANVETRVLSPAEQLNSVERLKQLYQSKKERGEKVPGRIRERIADSLGISPAQVGKLERLSALEQEDRQQFDAGELSVNEATQKLKEKPEEKSPPKVKAPLSGAKLEQKADKLLVQFGTVLAELRLNFAERPAAGRFPGEIGYNPTDDWGAYIQALRRRFTGILDELETEP